MTGTEVQKVVDACLSIVMLTDMAGDVTDKKKKKKKRGPLATVAFYVWRTTQNLVLKQHKRKTSTHTVYKTYTMKLTM